MAAETVVQTLAEMMPGELPPDAEAEQVQPTLVLRRELHVPNGTTQATLEIPLDNLSDPNPGVVVPGYMGIRPAYRRFRQAGAQNGKAMATVRPIRDLSHLATFDPRHLRHPEILARQTTEQLVAWACSELGVDQADLLPHSMGGPTAMAAVEHNPEPVRSVLLMAAAGMEDHSMWEMRKRAKDFIKDEIGPNIRTLREENEAKMALEVLHYCLRNPVRTVVEAIGVSGCDIRPKILRARANGVKIGALLFASDALFVESNVREQSGDIVDLIETYEDPKAGHMALQLHAAGVARKMKSMLGDLNPQPVPAAA